MIKMSNQIDANSIIQNFFRLAEDQKVALGKLGIHTICDLLYHFPSRYGDTAEMKNISSLQSGEHALIFAKLKNLKASKAYFKKIPMASAVAEDDTGSIKIVWYNQPYIAKMIGENTLARIEGKVAKRNSSSRQARGEELYISNPKIEKVAKLPIGVGNSLFGEEGKAHHLYPVYPESHGITSNWFYHAIQKILKSGVLKNVRDIIPTEVLDKYNLPCLKTSLVWI